jgi:hypothetical protein
MLALMRATELTDEQWDCLKPLLAPDTEAGTRPRANDRRTLNAVLYLVRIGSLGVCVPRVRISLGLLEEAQGVGRGRHLGTHLA